MSDCCKDSNAGQPISKDCDECQKTLKDHLRECADYGKLPVLVQKCEDLQGGCSVGKPDSCPAPPPPCPAPCPPPKPDCGVPATTFTCPASDCPKDCGAKKPSVPEGCGTKKPSCTTSANDNSCDVKKLSMDKKK